MMLGVSAEILIKLPNASGIRAGDILQTSLRSSKPRE